MSGYYSVCPKCGSTMPSPTNRGYVCAQCHEIVSISIGYFETNVETLKPYVKSRVGLLLAGFLLLAVCFTSVLFLGVDLEKEYFAAVVVPPLLGGEVYLMSKHKVLVQYKVIYKDVDPKLFEFYRVVYIGVIALILAVFTFPHALDLLTGW